MAMVYDHRPIARIFKGGLHYVIGCQSRWLLDRGVYA